MTLRYCFSRFGETQAARWQRIRSFCDYLARQVSVLAQFRGSPGAYGRLVHAGKAEPGNSAHISRTRISLRFAISNPIRSGEQLLAGAVQSSLRLSPASDAKVDHWQPEMRCR